jgi:hypothetical protein
MDYIGIEEDELITGFNLLEVIEFQGTHKIEVVRGADYQYSCIIDNVAYTTSLTPLHCIMTSIKQYRKQ